MSASSDLGIKIRPMDEDEPGEDGFVAGVWQTSFREDMHRSSQRHPAYQAIKPALKALIRRQVNALLAKPGTVVLLASNPEDDQHFLGFIAYEAQSDLLIVHYLYVKQIYRKMGVGRALLEAACGTAQRPIIYTHRTFKGAAYMAKAGALYMPHMT